jgi:hypothetical protein
MTVEAKFVSLRLMSMVCLVEVWLFVFIILILSAAIIYFLDLSQKAACFLLMASEFSIIKVKIKYILLNLLKILLILQCDMIRQGFVEDFAGPQKGERVRK